MLGLLLALLPTRAAAKGPGDAVMFVGGWNTSSASTLADFSSVAQALQQRGYTPNDFSYFSYAGWGAPYGPCDTEKRGLSGVQAMLADQGLTALRQRPAGARLSLVGHSFGGLAAYELAASTALPVGAVVAIDAPLHGITSEDKLAMDLLSCNSSSTVGKDLLAIANVDQEAALERVFQQASKTKIGVVQNLDDCLYWIAGCPFSGFSFGPDIRSTQIAPADWTYVAAVPGNSLDDSHVAVLREQAAVQAVATFVATN